MLIVSRAAGFIRRSMLLAAPLLALISASPATAEHLRYGWEKVDGINIFYREGGRTDAPVIVFLHGNPSSSLQYEEVMENLLDTQDVRVVALRLSLIRLFRCSFAGKLSIYVREYCQHGRAFSRGQGQGLLLATAASK